MACEKRKDFWGLTKGLQEIYDKMINKEIGKV